MVVLVYNKQQSSSQTSWRQGTTSQSSWRQGTANSTSAAQPRRASVTESVQEKENASDADALRFRTSSCSFMSEVDFREPEDGSGEANNDQALLADAEVRAEQQIQCHTTMLTLRDAFENALNMQQEAEARRTRDREKIALLQERHKADQKRIADLLGEGSIREQLETTRRQLAEAKEQIWENRLLNQKGSFNFVLQLSQEAHPLGALGRDEDEAAGGGQTADEADAGSAGWTSQGPQTGLAHTYDSSGAAPTFAGGSAAPPPESQGSKSRRMATKRQAAPPMEASTPSASSRAKATSTAGEAPSLAREATSDPSSSDQTSTDAAKGAAKGSTSSRSHATNVADALRHETPTAGGKSKLTGDNLFLSWVLKLWKHRITTHGRTADKGTGEGTGLPSDCGVQTDDYLGALQRQHDLALEAERRRAQALEDEVMDLRHDLGKLKEQTDQERESLSKQLASATADTDRLSMDLHRAQMEMQSKLAEKNRELSELREQMESQRDAMQRQIAALEHEKRVLKGTLRDMKSELEQALIQARRMELLVQKLKNGSGSALQEKIAQLIADLQLATTKLKQACFERDDALDKNDKLYKHLGSTMRKMELERQFLPLIHQAKGPVGQQHQALMKTKSEPKLPSLAQPEMLH